jgi:hypothetical protein
MNAPATDRSRTAPNPDPDADPDAVPDASPAPAGLNLMNTGRSPGCFAAAEPAISRFRWRGVRPGLLVLGAPDTAHDNNGTA